MARQKIFPLPCSLRGEEGIPEATIAMLLATAPAIRRKDPPMSKSCMNAPRLAWGKSQQFFRMFHPTFFKLSGFSLCQGEDTAIGRP